MFKRAIITDECCQDFERAASIAKQMGLEGLELRSAWDKGPHLLSDEDIDRVKSISESTGMPICAISAPFFKCHLDNEDEYKQHIDILNRCIAIGKRLRTNIVRGFAFWHKPEGLDAYFDQIIEKFKVPVGIVESEGIILALENEPSCFCNNAKAVRRMVDAIGSKNVLPLWDPGNDIYDFENEVPYPDGYRLVKSDAIHMHIKDSKRDETGKAGPAKLGFGEVDMVGWVAEVLRDGYSGWMTLETHYRVQGQLSEQLLNLPAGSSFSAGGEVASIECIREWDRIIDEAKKLVG